MDHRFRLGDTVAIFDGQLHPDDDHYGLEPGVRGVIIRIGSHRDYRVRFDGVEEFDGSPLKWWLWEYELVDPFESINADIASLL